MHLFRTVGGRLFLSYPAVVCVGLFAAAVASGGLPFQYENHLTPTPPPEAAAGGQGLIVVARPRAVFADAIRALLPSLVIAALIAAGFALVVAGLLARTITKPLRELAGKVGAFAKGDYAARVPLAGPTEVR